MDSIIVIGGGAAGLMAANELSKHKLPVTVIEAKNRLGGRIHTLSDNKFSEPVELGAEFIHGDLPITFSLLKKAGIQCTPVKGKMFHLEKGEFKKQNDFAEDWNTLMKQMKQLKEDIPIGEFLETYFSDDKYKSLRESVKNFAGGFDLADMKTASTKALYEEWNNEAGKQYRIDGGYQKLIDFLAKEILSNKCIIQTNCCAKKIGWKENEVNIITLCSRIFQGDKIIVTVPLSVLQSPANDENYLEFTPSIPAHIEAAKNIGFGTVIKILIEFTEAFWREKKKDIGFIFSSEKVPTWWTQSPKENAILTGWLGSERANSLKDKTEEEIYDTALQSLANAFNISFEDLTGKVKAFKIVNWNNIADINGGYSFNTTNSVAAKRILQQPVNDTIFFAGEALFDGVPCGTVEAALQSGKTAAEHLLKTIQ